MRGCDAGSFIRHDTQVFFFVLVFISLRITSGSSGSSSANAIVKIYRLGGLLTGLPVSALPSCLQVPTVTLQPLSRIMTGCERHGAKY